LIKRYLITANERHYPGFGGDDFIETHDDIADACIRAMTFIHESLDILGDPVVSVVDMSSLCNLIHVEGELAWDDISRDNKLINIRVKDMR